MPRRRPSTFADYKTEQDRFFDQFEARAARLEAETARLARYRARYYRRQVLMALIVQHAHRGPAALDPAAIAALVADLQTKGVVPAAYVFDDPPHSLDELWADGARGVREEKMDTERETPSDATAGFR